MTSADQLVCFYAFAYSAEFILEQKGAPPCSFLIPPFGPPESMYKHPATLHIDLCTGKKSVSITLIDHVASAHFNHHRYTCKINSCQIDYLWHCLSHLLG